MSRSDPFLHLERPGRVSMKSSPGLSTPVGHAQRAHSKFSASGAERWFKCSGSVALSEGKPDIANASAMEGTRAHEVLEKLMRAAIQTGNLPRRLEDAPSDMGMHAWRAANSILSMHAAAEGSELLVESRIYLDFIHPEMFGTFDSAVIDHFDTLHVIDYKYGKHPVSPNDNLQMIFYGIGLAHRYLWNFKKARLWIIQPRVFNYEGPVFWEAPIAKLKAYVGEFEKAVERVEREPENYVEGSWCFFCKGKSECPLKREEKLERAVNVFSRANIVKTMREEGVDK